MFDLHQGDTLGIVSPSAPIAGLCPKRLQRGVAALEKLGYKVKLGKNVSNVSGYTAGTISERADDIHEMFEDSEVKAIVSTIGGYNANDLLGALDYDLIAKHPKLFIGYSDITVLLAALSKLSKIKTLYGPMVLPQFGEYPKAQEFTLSCFETIVQNIGSGREYSLPTSKEWTEEMLFWDKEDNRAREMKKNNGWKIINHGQAEGKIIAGNLCTLGKIVGTPFIFDFNDSILFLEDDDMESPSTLRRTLFQIKYAGLLNGVKGLVFGRFQQKSQISDEELKKIIGLTFENNVNFPVISGVDFGHTDPVLTLPIGNRVQINTRENKIVVTL